MLITNTSVEDPTAVERTRHISDDQGQILALTSAISQVQAFQIVPFTLYNRSLYLDPVPPAEHFFAKDRLGIELERVLRELGEHFHHEHQRREHLTDL